MIHNGITMGADPEFFFTIKGKTIGAEKILPKEGLDVNVYGKVIIDGIQAELNPKPSHCRAYVVDNISNCFKAVAKTLKNHPEVTAEFAQTVAITKEEMKSLAAENKQFGCTPSRNAYTEKTGIKIKDAAKYFKRSAGGHIHLGHNNNQLVKTAMENSRRMSQMLDIIVGNTCVLLDRNPGNLERRKNYGKAGEYRTPKHGIEYRTPSNFWLQSQELTSFVFGLARFAVNIMANTTETNDIEKTIRDKVNMRKIRKAINTNNFELAYENFRKIESTLLEIVPAKIEEGKPIYDNYSYPITPDTINEFHYVIKTGVNHWFKEDPLKHWVNVYAGDKNGHSGGWEKFLMTTVRKELTALEANV